MDPIHSTTEFEKGLEAAGGRYRSLSHLGSGGMGVVYRAEDRDEGRSVAIKTLHQLDPRALLRLKAEFRSTADVVHPNLAKLYELGSVDDHWYVVMEFVKGMPMSALLAPGLGPSTLLPGSGRAPSDSADGSDPGLTTYTIAALKRVEASDVPANAPSEVRTHPTLAAEVIRDLFGQLAQALEALHLAGKLHCDVKSGNVMVEEGGRVVLLDFGLIVDRPEDGDDGPAEIAGTPAYMAPEQCFGMRATAASDWYAFGVMLYEALAGRLPFFGTTTEVLQRKQLIDPPALTHPPDDYEDLVELCMDLLSREPAQRPDAKQILAVLGARSGDTGQLAQSPLVGRAAEEQILRATWDRVRDGEPAVVLLHGASGTGKTFLADHFLDEIARGGSTVLGGRCYEHEAVPYKALDSLVDALATDLAGRSASRVRAWTPRHLAELVMVFPILGRVGAFEHPERALANSGRDIQELRRRAFRALKQLLGHMCDHTDLVLHIDDAQWGDRDSGQMLNELLSPPDAPRVLVLVSYRTEEAASSPFLEQLALGARTREEQVPTTEVHVGPLEASDARVLAGALLGVEPTDPRVIAVAEQSQGIPFFVEALARHAAGGGEVLSLEEVVGARVRGLSDAERRFLTAISVATRPLPRDVAIRASGGIEDVRGLVKVLTTGHLMRSSADAGDERYEAYHDRIRESVARMLQPMALAAQHQALAEAWEERGEADPEALYTHWRGAQREDKAGPYAVLAGDRASEALAFDTAAAFYAHAAELLPDDHSLAAKRADALVNAGRLAQAAPLYLEAAAAVEDTVQARALKRRAAEQYLLSGDYDAGLEVIQPLLKGAGLPYPRSPGWALFGLITRSIQLSIRGTKYTARAEADIPRDVLDQIDTAWTAGKGLGSVDIMRGGYFILRSAGLALAAGEPARISRGLGYVGLLGVSRGTPRDVASGMAYLDLAEKVGEELEDPHVLGFARINRGTADMTIGNWADSRDHIEAGIRLLEEQCTGVGWEISFGRSILMCSQRFLGAQAAVLLSGGEWDRAASENGDKYGGTWIRIYLGEALMGLDEPERGLALIDETLAAINAPVVTPMHVTGTVFASELERYRGDPAASLRRLDEMWKPAESSFAMGWQSTKLVSLLSRATSHLDLAAQGQGDPKAHLAAGLADAKAMIKEQRHYCRASGLLALGVHAHLTGRDDEAIRHLAESAEIFEERQMRLYAAVARHRRGELLGGDEGQTLVDGARAVLEAERVADIPRWLNVHAPGFA